MDLNELLKPYKKKIIAEAVLKAVFTALVVGLAVVVVALGGVAIVKAVIGELNQHWPIIQTKTMANIITWATGAVGVGISGALGFVVAIITGVISFFVFFKIGMKNTVQKVDALGLYERVVTMVELQDNTSYVAHIQRQDAIDKITNFDMSVVKVRPQKSKVIASIALALVIAILSPIVVFAIPIDPGMLKTPDEKYNEQAALDNDQIINDIQNIIDEEPPVSEDKKEDLIENKDELNQKLDEILGNEALTPEQKEEERKEAFEEAIKENEKLLEQEKIYIEELIDALKGHSQTATLGAAIDMLYEAIQNKDGTKEAKKQINNAMNDLKNRVFDESGYYNRLIADIESAVSVADEVCGISEEEPHALKTAILAFRDNLVYLRDEVDVDGADLDTVESEIKAKFDESEKAIVEAVEDIKDLEDKIDKIEDKLKEEIEKIEANLPKEELPEPEPEDPLEEEKEDVKQDFDEIEETIKDSDMNQEDKDDLQQDIDDLEQKVDDILNQMPELKDEIDRIMDDENRTDEEKSDALKDIVDRNDEGLTEEEKEQIKEDIENILNQAPNLKDEIDRIMSDENKTDEEKKDALKDVVDRNDEGLTEDQKEQIKNDIDSIIDDPNKTDEEKKEDIYESMKPVEDNYNSQTNEDKKEDVYESMKPVEDNYNNQTDEDKKQDASDAVHDKQDQLETEVENDKQSQQEISDNLKDNPLKDSDDETEKEIGEALENLGNALEKGDEEAIGDAMDQLENIINGKDPETGEDKGLTDEEKQEIADKVSDALHNAVAPATPSDMKDAMGELVEDLKNNSQNAEENGTSFEEQLGEAFDKAEEGIGDSMAETETKEEVADQLDGVREDLVGSNKSETDDMIDDIRQEINNSDLSPSAKDEANDVLDNLENKLDDMIQNGASDSEISSEIENAKDQIGEIIENDKNQTSDTSDSLKDNQTTSDIQNAIQSGDKDALEDAFENLENQLKGEDGEYLKGDALDQVLGDMAQDFKDAADALPDGELKDAMNNLAGSFEQAKQEAANNDNSTGENPEKDAEDDQKATGTATGALDQAKEDIGNFMDKIENMEQTGENVSDRFDQAQGTIMGQPPQDQESSDSESDSSQKNDQQSSNNQQNQNGESNNENKNDDEEQKGDGESSSDEQQPDPENPSNSTGGAQEGEGDGGDAYIPGDVTMDDLINSGALEDQYDKQFEGEYSDEEREGIENYYEAMKGNGAN